MLEMIERTLARENHVRLQHGALEQHILLAEGLVALGQRLHNNSQTEETSH